MAAPSYHRRYWSDDLSTSAYPPHDTVAVLGLLTTKDARLKDRGEIEARLREAEKVRALEKLAISTQCGFASATNAPMSPDEQRAKLQLVADVAHSVWS